MKKFIRLSYKLMEFFIEYFTDLYLFIRYNSHSPFERRVTRENYHTIIKAHTIEKGLALPVPKPYFGKEKIKKLLIDKSKGEQSFDNLGDSMLIGAIREYSDLFKSFNVKDEEFVAQIDSFIQRTASHPSSGGTYKTTYAPIEDKAAISFLNSRFSARSFSQKLINDEALREIVILSQKTPSQCNRQSTKIHVYRNQTKIKQLLDLQGGARGFSDFVPNLFLVTSELTAWGSASQRNQAYIDGALHSMMLMLALGAKGFVSCPLNLAVKNSVERKIKLEGRVPKPERLIMMIAAGEAPETGLRAANSPRKGIEQMLTIHDN